MKKIELLSPAGNFEMLRAAVENGADAVYMGLDRYNARAMTNNFTKDEYIEAIKYAHLRNVKVYITLNILMLDSEIKEALEDLKYLYKYGLDGVIIQDIGLASLIHKIMPDLELHASTQMSVTNLEQVKYLENLGYKRVVLGRELTISEIEYICKNTNVEIEVFVHGALCVCVSGQCLLSSLIGGRSGNRGACAQPCRTRYTLYNKKDECIEEKKYLLSKKDIYGLDHIEKLINAGVASLKIEGRNKPSYYVATVTEMYRKYIDSKEKVSLKDEKNILQVFNRSGKSYGYLEKVEKKNSITAETPKNTGLVLGKVLSVRENFVKVRLEEKIDLHDGIEIYSQNGVCSTIVTCIKDENNKIVNKEVEKNNIVYLGDIKQKVEVGSNIYKTTEAKLNKALEYIFKNEECFKKKISAKLNIKILKDKNIEIEVKDENNNCIKYDYEYIPQVARTSGLTEDSVKSSLSKTNNSVIEFEEINLVLEDNLFIPVSMLNTIRRDIILRIESKYIFERDIKDIDKKIEKELKCIDSLKNIKIDNLIKKSVYLCRYSRDRFLNVKASTIYINIKDYVENEEEINSLKKNKKIYIMLPNVAFNPMVKFINENIDNIAKDVSGFIISSIGDIPKCLELKKKYTDLTLIANSTLNITNLYTAKYYLDLGINKFSLMPDLDLEEYEIFKRKLDVEMPSMNALVMTSRYCILGSFISRGKVCDKPCTKDEYYLLDQKSSKLNIVCNNIDCTMRIFKKIDNFKEKDINIRENII